MMLINDLTNLFSGMSIAPFICIILGLMLIIVEFFQPTNRKVGTCGVLVLGGGMALRMMANGTLGMLFCMIVICLIILFAAHMIMLAKHKREWLSHSAALSVAYRELEQQDDIGYSFIEGREGIATTDIDGSGHMSVNEVNFFVTAQTFIKKGESVRVIAVDDDKIIVEPIAMPEEEKLS